MALDGESGAGKSTLAQWIEGQFEVALIQLDDFFSAEIPDRHWDEFSAEETGSRVRLEAGAFWPIWRYWWKP